jgi:hypothetical protein
MDRASFMSGVPVGLSELRSIEWLHLTFGFFWRSGVWGIVASLVGTLVSYVVAYGTTKAMGHAPDPTVYRRIAVPLTLAVSVGIAFLMFRWYTRWILTGRYGPLRLVVVRDASSERPVGAA